MPSDWMDRILGPQDSGPACEYCAKNAVLRWCTRRRQWYCVDCWLLYKSEVANALALSLQDGNLGLADFSYPTSCLCVMEGEKGCVQIDPGNCDASHVEFTGESSFIAAARILKENSLSPSPTEQRPIVLNMANSEWFGGGVLTGANGQEEELCLSSDLLLRLWEAARSSLYPLPSQGVILTPSTKVFRRRQAMMRSRNLRKVPFEPLEAPFCIAVATAAAPCRPDLSCEQKRAEYREVMKAKIIGLLLTLEKHGYTQIILSAWGCGSFRNPPEEVASLFHAILGSLRFRKSFSKVVFSILDDKEWGESNLDVFKRVFER